ncbi:WD40-repeat-containing domain protein [Halteromyces radiatus]|uniref:WD40-repeat-containing domain protein n=1 Tax=Halteromyces radiatus TaxID=101107 RepID=UPI00221E4DC0|nr:WD40-repeat-containing domain protein [Halteromyces radiatus]KAI8099716.1 WD40-repeat-containing domain protein [Halteromyces radiatus]
MSLALNTDDALRLIIQFLRENNLQQTLSALQNESPLVFNTVENKEAFTQDILQGRWVSVLKQVNTLKLPIEKLYNVFELALVELVEQGEKDAATMVLNSPVLQSLRRQDTDRYGKLDHLIDRLPQVDFSDIYDSNSTKEQRRKKVAEDICKEITDVPPSRLLTLLSQSLLWQQQNNGVQLETGYDLFKGMMPIQTTEDACVSTPYVSIKFPGKKTYAECAAFAPHGQFLATGTVDGFIELWNYNTGKLRKDFKYQAEDNLMAMNHAVTCLNFSMDGEFLATGSMDGTIAVWKVASGVCVRRISSAHSQGVSSLCFNKDGTQILSGSYDHSIRIHGLKSGKTLKEFRGHTSFINSLLFSPDNTRVLSASSDGTVKIWDSKATTCLYSIIPQPQIDSNSKSNTIKTAAAVLNPIGGLGSQSVQQILPLPKHTDQYLVCNKSDILYIINIRGQILKTFTYESEKGVGGTNASFITAATSPQGEYIYGVDENSVLYCFQTNNGTLVKQTKLTTTEITGMAGHPLSNVLVVYDDAGYVYFLRP